ncbi:MAG: nicotinate-nicotinamide nucleotide adenylyltransferase [Bacilli bacterium]|nr:nicotinate-nicotinamide nucleotide adenylyltransferase [Bacilli bacterium]
MNLGIYPGSFNPPHDGHIKIVKFLLNNNYVDKVLMLPTPNYWNKQDLIDLKHRIAMLKYYETKDIIIDDIHNNYPFTYQVLQTLEKDYPRDYLYLIIGSDNLLTLDKWKNIDDILKHQIIVMNRGTSSLEIEKMVYKLGKEHFIIINDFPYMNISSTMIREGSNKYLNIKVLNYIKNNHLYGR